MQTSVMQSPFYELAVQDSDSFSLGTVLGGLLGGEMLQQEKMTDHCHFFVFVSRVFPQLQPQQLAPFPQFVNTLQLLPSSHHIQRSLMHIPNFPLLLRNLQLHLLARQQIHIPVLPPAALHNATKIIPAPIDLHRLLNPAPYITSSTHALAQQRLHHKLDSLPIPKNQVASLQCPAKWGYQHQIIVLVFEYGFSLLCLLDAELAQWRIHVLRRVQHGVVGLALLQDLVGRQLGHNVAFGLVLRGLGVTDKSYGAGLGLFLCLLHGMQQQRQDIITLTRLQQQRSLVDEAQVLVH